VSSEIRARISGLGFSMPQVAPTREFVRVAYLGNVAYVSGHAPFDKGAFQYIGKVGQGVDLDTACRAAELSVLGCLASLEAELGSLDRVARIIKVNGYVNCAPDFEELSHVTDVASRLLIAIFGESGRHARTTVGVANLPFSVTVEMELVVLIK